MKKLVIAGFSAIVIAMLMAVVQTAEAQTKYPITWSSSVVSEVVAQGKTTSVQLSLLSKSTLRNITLEITPTLAPLLAIQPIYIGVLNAGQSQNIQLTVGASSGTPVGSYSGTIHLRVGSQTLPQTVKVVIVVSKAPVTVPIPAGFQPNSQVISQGGPVLLNNFGSQYQNGGLVPPGGAEISITTMPLPPPPLSSLIANELQGATISSTKTIIVSGTSCTEVFYSDSFGQNYNYSNIAVYCPNNSTLYKLFLFYTASDPASGQFLAAFQQILSNIEFTF